MHKLAIFVEGQTEEVFAAKLVEEIAGKNRVIIERRKASGGRRGTRTLELVACSEDIGQEYYVLIVDCGGDSSVKSDIRDRYDGLAKNDYESIIAIRDVYPDFSHEDVPKLRRGLASGLKTEPIEVVFALAIMEIEAWFIAEHGHFAKISRDLTLERISKELGFDPSQDDIELRNHPAQDLDAIYRLVGPGYNKNRNKVERTVNALDYAHVYLSLGDRIPDLKRLLDCIDDFLSIGNKKESAQA